MYHYCKFGLLSLNYGHLCSFLSLKCVHFSLIIYNVYTIFLARNSWLTFEIKMDSWVQIRKSDVFCCQRKRGKPSQPAVVWIIPTIQCTTVVSRRIVGMTQSLPRVIVPATLHLYLCQCLKLATLFHLWIVFSMGKTIELRSTCYKWNMQGNYVDCTWLLIMNNAYFWIHHWFLM
jgi:hypothetical protein